MSRLIVRDVGTHQETCSFRSFISQKWRCGSISTVGLAGAAVLSSYSSYLAGVYIVNSSPHTIHRTIKFASLKTKAAGDSNQGTKPDSLICADCDGNGAVQCTQCKGGGVNIVAHFNGKFKVGDSCWLCGGKKDVLCGNCNGAGFVGGFLSGFDN